MSSRDARLVENQKLFRTANAGLERAIAEKVSAERRIPFLCECSDEVCMETVAITLATYGEVRSHPKRFFIVTGHQMSPGEKVLVNRDGYSIVEKSDDA
jgi:hypothetical protein